MLTSVIVNIKFLQRILGVVLFIFTLSNLFALPIKAQGERIEPFADLLKKPIAIRSELNNIHPRLFLRKEICRKCANGRRVRIKFCGKPC